MKKLYLLAFLVYAIGGVSFADDRPKIVLIMADDLGLGDVGYHVRTQQNKEPLYETPAIDGLAKQGLWFTDGHSATALCSPTRYCVMSGNNNYRSNAPWGVWNTFRETAFKKGEATLGSVVKAAGYQTGFIGKWHLGGDFKSLTGPGFYRGTDDGNVTGKVDVTKFVSGGPRDCGFDYDFTLPCGIQGPIYVAYENQTWYPLSEESKIVFLNKDNAINPNDITSKGPGLGDSSWDASEMGKVLSQKAVEFIKSSSSKDQPFFLYYCSPMVHVPHCPPEEFDGKKIKGQTPSEHLDMVLDFDQQVNRLVGALKETKTFDNTLFVLVSDNGGLQVNKKTAAAGHKSSGGWAGSKNSPLEGGTRTPFIAVWPGHIKPGMTDEPAINQDVVATFAVLVGTKIPDDQAMDSNNLLPLLTGEGTFNQRDVLVQQAGSKKELMYRNMPWKLIIQCNPQQTQFDPIAIYNLEDNPYELRNKNMLNDANHKQVVDRMLKEYKQIFDSRQRTAPLTSAGN